MVPVLNDYFLEKLMNRTELIGSFTGGDICLDSEMGGDVYEGRDIEGEDQ